MTTASIQAIATIYNDLPQKFGIPRQSGLVPELTSTIVMEPAFRNPDALRGLDGFSHIWLIWQFSDALRPQWSPTVRPPELGGNVRMGVFATRSPFRPNGLGLSSVRLLSIDWQTPRGPVLCVAGADLKDGTPIFDIKPYLPYTDAHPEAASGFAEPAGGRRLAVNLPEALSRQLPEEKRQALLGILAHDPRPHYQKDSQRIYGLDFAGFQVRFTVADDTVTVLEISPLP